MAWSCSIQEIVWNSGTKITAQINVSNFENEKFRVRLERARSIGGPWSLVASKVIEKGESFLNPIYLSDSGIPKDGAFHWRLRMTHARELFVGNPTSAPRYSTPKAPSRVMAERVEADILRVSTVGRGEFANEFEVRAGGLSATNTTGTFVLTVSPSSTYEVQVRQRRKVSAVSFGAWSEWSTAVSVPLPLAPAAPVVTGPQFGVVLAGTSPTVSWKHSPRGNGHSPQSMYELRYRPVGGSWTVLAGSGTTAKHTVPIATVGRYEVQVRTAGSSLVFGPWSSAILVVGADAPTVTVSRPVSPTNASWILVQWLTEQAQSYPQTQWQATLLRGTEVLQTLSGIGGTKAAQFTKRVTNGAHSVRIEVWCSGLPGKITHAFVVDLDPPAVPVVTSAWDEELGCMHLQVTPGEGGTKPTVRLDLERSIDGEPWRLVAAGGLSISAQDFEARSNGLTQYRATAWTGEDCPADGTVDAVADSTSVWLGTGPGFTRAARLPWNPDYGIDAGRERSVQQYAGRALPVAYAGEALSRVVKVAGLVLEDSDDSELSAYVDDVLTIGQDASALHMVRDPQGRIIYGSISEVSTDRDRALGAWSFSFDLTETEH